MRVISISKKRFDSLKKVHLCDVNTEADLYSFTYHGVDKLLKKLYVSDGINFAKKLFTLEVLSSYDLPSCFVVPDSLVSVNKEVVGFSIPCIDGITLKGLFDNDYPFEVKIKYLKDIGLILDKMVNIRKHTDLKHFYLNDVHESNFMVNYDTGELCVIDLDGCKVNGSFSFPARYLTPRALLNSVNKYNIDNYRHGAYVMADYNSDLYCYVIIVLNFLYGDCINNLGLSSFYDYLNYLERIGINKDLLVCFSRIVSYGDNINPMNYLDSLTSEQVCRAKKRVYSIVKK